MSEQKIIATKARRNISYGLVMCALVALIFSFALIMQGVGAEETTAFIQIFDMRIAPGTVGASFLVVAGLSIWAVTKTKPAIQRN